MDKIDRSRNRMNAGTLFMQSEGFVVMEVRCKYRYLPKINEPWRAVGERFGGFICTPKVRAISLYGGEILFACGTGCYRLVPDGGSDMSPAAA